MKIIDTEKDNILDRKITVEFTVRELAYIAGSIGNVPYKEVVSDVEQNLGMGLTTKDIESAENSMTNPLISGLRAYLNE